MTSCFRQVWNEIKWILFTYGWDSYMREWSMWRVAQWVTPYSIDIIWLLSGTLFVGYHIRKNTPQIYFYQETVRHLWIILIIRKRRWNLWVVGISKWRHHPQQQQQTTSMADVTSVWHLFDSNVRIVEWFSWLIIKTVLDRYRQVVTTNTCVFSLTGPTYSLPTYSKSKKIEHY